jgi:hypothetical protein
MSKTLARITWKFISENDKEVSQEDSVDEKKLLKVPRVG